MLNRDDADPDDYLAILSRQLLCADECIVELERQLAEGHKYIVARSIEDVEAAL
jgi:uncharacterized protein YlzI (FlbEa/FlbD family)